MCEFKKAHDQVWAGIPEVSQMNNTSPTPPDPFRGRGKIMKEHLNP